MYKKFKNQSLKNRIKSYLQRPPNIIWLDIKIGMKSFYKRVKALFLAPFPHDDIIFWKDRDKDVEYMFQLKYNKWKYNTIEDAYKDYDEFIELSELLKDPKYKYVVRRFNGRLLYALYNNLIGQNYNDCLMIDVELFKQINGDYWKIYQWGAKKWLYNNNLVFYTNSGSNIKNINTYYLFFLCLWRELMNDLRQRNYFIAHNICKIIKKDWIKKNGWFYADF